jgi:hypothetical protein
VLVYYDKTYRTGLKGRDLSRVIRVPVTDGIVERNAALVLKAGALTGVNN